MKGGIFREERGSGGGVLDSLSIGRAVATAHDTAPRGAILTMAKILIVDDSKFSRSRAAEGLRRAGHEVVEAADGAAGLDAVAAHDPDCVLLDMLMPILDGPGFLAGLRESGSNLPVLVLTADIQAGTRAICDDYGVRAFLQKPARSDEILRLVDEALGVGQGGVACV